MKVPALFQAAANYKDQWELRDYMTDEMVAMAESGTLSPTVLMLQPPKISEMAGNILLGQEFRDDGTMAQGQDIPQALADYRVKLKAMHGAKHVLLKQAAKMSGRVYRGQGSAAVYSSETKELPFGEDGTLSLSLPQAWRVLRFCGAHCRKVKRADAQKRIWLCEEVIPGGNVGEEHRRRRAVA